MKRKQKRERPLRNKQMKKQTKSSSSLDLITLYLILKLLKKRKAVR